MIFNRIYSFLICLLLSTHPAFALELACRNGSRGTQVFLSDSDNKMNIRIINPMGYEHMPQFDGPVSQAMIPFIKMQADDLKQIGDTALFQFDKMSCQHSNDNPEIFSCTNNPPKISNGINVLSVRTSRIVSNDINGNYSNLNFHFVLESVNTYFVDLKFPEQLCFIKK